MQLFIVMVLILIGALIGALGAWLLSDITALERRIGELESAMERRRHTKSAVAGLEDAAAIGIDTLLHIEAVLKFVEARKRQELDVIGSIRQGPNAYEPKPNGKTQLVAVLRDALENLEDES